MKLGIAADSHGDWRALDAWAAEHALDLVVHCGDVGIAPTGGVPVLAARGNHDQRLASSGQRPRFVDDYAIVELAGLRWLFLGCVSGQGDVAPAPAELPGPDVLISHESPLNPHLGWTGHPIVHEVVRRVQPALCFSGHWHQPARGRIGRTDCRALGAEPHGWLTLEAESGKLRVLGER